MADRTISLLNSIKNALISGRLSVKDISTDDILMVVENELNIAKQTFSRERFNETINLLSEASGVECTVVDDYVAIVDLALSCLGMIPDSTEFYSKEYWRALWDEKYDEEVDEVVDYITTNGQTSVFNYYFKDKYVSEEVEVYIDESNGFSYVTYLGHRMYFPISWNRDKIKNYVCGIMLEQDVDSPHCYKKAGFEVKEGDVVIDAGVAEGNFALSVVDKVGKIYLVEADEEWKEALSHTFEPYADKVEFIYKYLDSVSDDEHITLSDICEKADYIKMDIEGYEKAALLGGVEIIKNSYNLRMAICSYHCDGDEAWITDFLSRNGVETTHSKGYMFPDWEVGALRNAVLRRGLVFGMKN